MSELFDDLCEGLQQAIDFEKGKGKAKVKTVVLSPVRRFDKGEIRTVRMAAGMTQSVFADFMGGFKKNGGSMGMRKNPSDRARMPAQKSSLGRSDNFTSVRPHRNLLNTIS